MKTKKPFQGLKFQLRYGIPVALSLERTIKIYRTFNIDRTCCSAPF